MGMSAVNSRACCMDFLVGCKEGPGHWVLRINWLMACAGLKLDDFFGQTPPPDQYAVPPFFCPGSACPRRMALTPHVYALHQSSHLSTTCQPPLFPPITIPPTRPPPPHIRPMRPSWSASARVHAQGVVTCPAAWLPSSAWPLPPGGWMGMQPACTRRGRRGGMWRRGVGPCLVRGKGRYGCKGGRMGSREGEVVCGEGG